MKSKSIKIRKEAQEFKRKAEKLLLENQCNCQHVDKETGKATLDYVENDPDNLIAFKCSQCHKVIMSAPKGTHFILPTVDNSKVAIASVDQVCDIVKMGLNAKSEKGKSFIETINMVQKALLTLPKAYSKIKDETENKKKKNDHKYGNTRRGGSRMYM